MGYPTTVFKAIRRVDGVLYSAVMKPGPACVHYVPDKWIYPPTWLMKHGYAITAFRTLAQAKRFASADDEDPPIYDVWEADSFLFRGLPQPLDWLGVDLDDLKKDTGRLWTEPGGWDEGTVGCSRIKLTKQIVKGPE